MEILRLRRPDQELVRKPSNHCISSGLLRGSMISFKVVCVYGWMGDGREDGCTDEWVNGRVGGLVEG